MGTSSAIPLGHETRLSHVGTSSPVPHGHELVYPAWARARLSHFGTSSSIPLRHEARLSHLGTRLVCSAWARGSSVPLGLRLLQPRGLLLIHSLCLRPHPGREARALPPSLGKASCRHQACAGLEPARALWLTPFTGARVVIVARPTPAVRVLGQRLRVASVGPGRWAWRAMLC